MKWCTWSPSGLNFFHEFFGFSHHRQGKYEIKFVFRLTILAQYLPPFRNPYLWPGLVKKHTSPWSGQVFNYRCRIRDQDQVKHRGKFPLGQYFRHRFAPTSHAEITSQGPDRWWNTLPPPQVEIYNRLGTAPVSQKDLQYWRGTGISTAYWTFVPCQYWNLYCFSTGITPESVVNRHLVSGLGLYYASTAPTLGPVPTAQYFSTWVDQSPVGLDQSPITARLDSGQANLAPVGLCLSFLIWDFQSGPDRGHNNISTQDRKSSLSLVFALFENFHLDYYPANFEL